MKRFILIIVVVCSIKSFAQGTEPVLEFQEIAFHISNWPVAQSEVSVRISTDSIVELSQRIYHPTGDLDSVRTGNFKGRLSGGEFKLLLSAIQKISWKEVASTINAGNKRQGSVIITYNHKTTRFAYGSIPDKAFADLESYVKRVAFKNDFKRFAGNFDFQVVDESDE
jgi:hypothetical protein